MPIILPEKLASATVPLSDGIEVLHEVLREPPAKSYTMALPLIFVRRQPK